MKKLASVLIACIIVFILFWVACQNTNKENEDRQKQYSNTLKIEGIPIKSTDLESFGFSDKGAWHAYSLPEKDSTSYWGGFVGPLTMKLYGQWLSKSLMTLRLKSDKGEILNYDRNSFKQEYLPGILKQSLQTQRLNIQQELVFADDRTALIKLKIRNRSNKKITITPLWYGNVLLNDIAFQAKGREARFILADSSFVFVKWSDTVANTYLSGKNFYAELHPVLIEPDGLVELSYSQSYFFKEQELEDREEAISGYLKYPDEVLHENKQRWNEYLHKAIDDESNVQNKRVVVKSLQTLISNWRSPAGNLKHHGIFPSSAYHGFYGFWSWDTWKHSVALGSICPMLAKEGIKSMFDYQNEAGMVADCIYFDLKENNWRNTKAPLAAWAVWKIFEATKDTLFVEELYPKVFKYHNWWYTERDRDRNGICEYGCTDGTTIAAKWESGMDNAVRFDHSVIKQVNASAWTFNQESVDLNAYLQKEKEYLARMARLLQLNGEAIKLEIEGRELKNKIINYFWSEEKGCFFDLNMDTRKLVEVFGPECWTLLWTEAASEEQAKRVIQYMKDTTRFNTYVPFPTLEASHPKFNPKRGYWRGPVWLDQAYFGIRALEKYGFKNDAAELQRKLIFHSKGLLNQVPIRENYHPITGEGLNAKHFSWSAAHILMLMGDQNNSVP